MSSNKNNEDIIINESNIDIQGKCMSCKYFEQGKKCSFCGHPNQTDKYLKGYVYWNFSCSLHEIGIAKSRIKYMENKVK